MGWLTDIVNLLLSPIYSTLYNTLIVGALEILNLTFQCFDLFAGSNTSNLLFNTSIVDGEPQLNFFQSDSPLKPIFMDFLYFGCCLFGFFVATAAVAGMSSLTGDKKVAAQKTKAVVGSITGVFFIPLVFIMALSLVGGLLDVISGGQVVISNNDITTFQTQTKQQLDKLLNQKDNILEGIDENQVVEGSLDESGNVENYTVAQIYSNMADYRDWEFDTADGNIDPISEAAGIAEQALYDITTMIKSAEYENNLNRVEQIINELEPNQTDQEKADELKDIIEYFSGINNQIHIFLDASNEVLLSYLEFELDAEGNIAETVDPKYIAIYNFKLAFETLFGTDSSMVSTSYNEITNLQALLTELNTLIDGSISGGSTDEIGASTQSGLTTLRQMLSVVEDNSLVVVMYQLTTGNTDTLWYEAKYITDLPQMMIIGAIIIAFAIFLMVQNILLAGMRIIWLGFWFCLSPVAIMMAPIDNWYTFKNWLKQVCANLVSVLGIVLTLQVFGVIYDAFADSVIETNATGSSVSLLNSFMLAMLGLAGIVAAKEAGTNIGLVFGFAAGMNARQQLNDAGQMLRGATKAMTKGAAGMATAALGKGWQQTMRGSGSSNKNGGSGEGGSANLFRARAREGLGSATARAMKPVTSLTRGKVGTSRSKANWADVKAQVAQHKGQIMGNKAAKTNAKLLNKQTQGSNVGKQRKLEGKRSKLVAKQDKLTDQAKNFNQMKDRLNPSNKGTKGGKE